MESAQPRPIIDIVVDLDTRVALLEGTLTVALQQTDDAQVEWRRAFAALKSCVVQLQQEIQLLSDLWKVTQYDRLPDEHD